MKMISEEICRDSVTKIQNKFGKLKKVMLIFFVRLYIKLHTISKR